MWKAFLVGLIFFASFAATSLTAVLATTSIVRAVGQAPLLAVWATKAILGILWATGSASLIVRIGARKMLVRSLVAAAVAYGLIAAVVATGSHAALGLALLVVFDDVQMNALHYAAWGVAREHMSSDETLRYFGRITAMCTAGTIVGTAAAALVLRFEVPPSYVLVTLAVAFAGITAVIPRALAVHSTPSFSMLPFASGKERGAGVREAAAFLRESPTLRPMAIAVIACGAAYTVLDYEIIRRLAAAPDFGFRYAGLTTLEPIVYVGVELALAPWAVRRFGTRALLATPLVLLFDFTLLAVRPSVASAFSAALLLQSAFGMETLVRSFLVSKAPARVRLSLGALNDGALYPIGYLLACAAIAATLLLYQARPFGDQALRAAQLVLGGVAAAFAVRRLTRAS